ARACTVGPSSFAAIAAPCACRRSTEIRPSSREGLKAREICLMSKVMVVTSGKGGVGKTTSTAALGAALAQAGQNVVLVDFDVGLRNLDLILGAERRGGGGL